MEQSYYLTGFLNCIDVTPYFVYLIFKGTKDNKLYFICGTSLLSKITEIVPVDLECYDDIVFIEEQSFNNSKLFINLDDDFMFGFKTSDGELIISDYANMRDFLKNYAVDDANIQKSINAFIAAKE